MYCEHCKQQMEEDAIYCPFCGNRLVSRENQLDRPLTSKEINQCRHKSEKRWYVFLCVLNILIILSVVTVFIVNFKDNLKDFSNRMKNEMNLMEEAMLEDLEAKNEEQKEESKESTKTSKETKKQQDEKSDKNTKEADEDVDTLEDYVIPVEVEYFILGIMILFILPFMLNIYYQSYRASAVPITPRNFPEIYDRIQLYAKRLGLKEVPEAYIMQENGVLNAFSAFIIKKQYIEICADLFEVAYREHKDIDAISFVIAHELAHIKLKHATFPYNIRILFSNSIPIFGSTASRAREYSCDRLAQKVTGIDGIDAMFALMVGKHLYKDVDKQAYLHYAQTVNGFFVWCVNLVSSHPVMTKRIQALAMKQGSGKLY